MAEDEISPVSIIDSAALVKRLRGRMRRNAKRLSQLDLDNENSEDTSTAQKLLGMNDALQDVIDLVQENPEGLRPKKKCLRQYDATDDRELPA